MQSKIVAITGTDTGVGKTWVGIGLSHALRNAGHSVLAIKPIETGCASGSAPTEDGMLLAVATGQVEPGRALLRYAQPLGAPLAAEREGREIDWVQLIQSLREHAGNADFLILEGAGGLLSPLTWQHSLLDLASALEASALLVAVDRLGTLHHVRSALMALHHRGLSLCGILLSPPREGDVSTGTNATSLRRITGWERIDQLPRTISPHEMANACRCVIPWLCEPLPIERW